MEKKRALQLFSVEQNRYRYFDCYSKQTSDCVLSYSQGQWFFKDESAPSIEFIVNGICPPTNVDTGLFLNKLPVISEDNYVDLLENGELVLMGKTIDSIVNHYIDRDTIINGDIIVVEKL